ncbi:protein adenylyltransferase SelO [uncultured Salipiger sp.]|jgi:serine/tyrosine/threonine adenylyltransferase|uniref:protein adenylyltransferase SelO n=1 Tax=uncultured Salipiger sp. TaxID=499810 RepID=UPI002593393E|nr:YdiU family protein [uncultured Salipiger sp.]
MTLHIPFDNSYARLPATFYTRLKPTPVARPSLVAFNAPLAEELGITGTDDPRLAPVLAGNVLPEGADPLAQLYAGHQFGGFSPQLGDGRAHLLGEVVDRSGTRRDIQLKGSGPTPYSRRGDGRAWLGPVLREYVVSEAMHALGVPTTRALAAVRTGEDILREGPLPGAILTRVAGSHIRVGTFQVFAARGDTEALRTLFDYTVERHYPGVTSPDGLLAAVCERQVALVAQWLSLGFIHGVMNTDNCTLSGETIDYGPCAFMDRYDPNQVYSSIDRYGRYAYSAQPDIVVWNMAQLATALVPLMPDADDGVQVFTRIVHGMADQLRAAWLQRFAAKLGIADPRPEDAKLVAGLLELMHKGQADFTNAFRALLSDDARDQFTDREAYDAWDAQWKARIESEPDPEGLMRRSNPAFIPRNHRIEQMIAAAVDGDESYFRHLNLVLSRPYEDQPDAAELQAPPTPDEVVPATFCGT